MKRPRHAVTPDHRPSRLGPWSLLLLGLPVAGLGTRRLLKKHLIHSLEEVTMPLPTPLTARPVRQLLWIAALLTLASSAQADICRVAAIGTAAANGSTWTQPTTLRDAIANSNGKNCTEIWVQRGSYAQSSEYVINRTLVLRGDFIGNEATADARALPLDPGRTTLDGGNATRILYIDGTTGSGPIINSTLIEGFTLTRGNGVGTVNGYGGAVFCNGTGTGGECSPRFSYVAFNGNVNISLTGGDGGAIYNDGNGAGRSNPVFSDVHFNQNKASGSGGGIFNAGIGGGTSSPTFTNVTFSGNNAWYGGAVYNSAKSNGSSNPTFTNVTFSGNNAGQDGGAVASWGLSGGTINQVFTHVTMHGNKVPNLGGAIRHYAAAGATSNAIFRNSILWGNTSSTGAAIANDGNGNGNATVGLGTSILQGGCAGAGISCDSFTGASGAADPLLAALQDNGGPTRTHLPGTGSPAIDRADASGCPATDQRGITRPQGAGCDIGAVEVQAAPVTYTITPDTDANGTISPNTPQITPAGATQTFTLSTVAGWEIDQVTGCGGTLTGTTYTTAPATADCRVLATFKPKSVEPTSYTITPGSGPNGTIDPATPQTAVAGSTQAFALTPAAGYVIDQVTGCGGTLAGTTYTTAPATADCSVQASFRLRDTAPPSAGAITPVPTLGTWGMLLLSLLAACVGACKLQPRVSQRR
ncbi:IPTL-CTERM sorting domain-containing protein [Ottowia thiooxydans]|uniref:Outer membrane repeat protein n=1 Tax=Ottowia thiooxydans TaxID=219182 RepID=A0ABV2QG73_9BURK